MVRIIVRIHFSRRAIDKEQSPRKKKMSSQGYRRQAPAPVVTEGPDEDYDYSAALKGTSYEDTYKKISPRKSPPKPEDPRQSKQKNVMEDPLLDLEQLEELHEEAERMKALGNKHMASQVRKALVVLLLAVHQEGIHLTCSCLRFLA